MVKILEDIWILDPSGVAVFSRVYDPKINEQLFGALMSALNAYAEKLSEGGISNFELSNLRFTIVKKNRLLFIASSKKKNKEKKIVQELQNVSEKFFELYSKELDNWDGEITKFKNFENKIEDSLEETLKKFHKAFW
ncbi:MAG: hypothetical protein ACTSRI_09810 [Promethearchaeota archaeon]